MKDDRFVLEAQFDLNQPLVVEKNGGSCRGDDAAKAKKMASSIQPTIGDGSSQPTNL